MAPAAVFVIAVLACSDFDRVLGLSGEQAPGGQSASARSEERRAVELSRTIPGLAGFFYDTSGNVIVAVTNVGAPTVTRARLQPLFSVELARSRRRHPSADVMVHGAQYTFLDLRNWRDGLEAGGVLALPGVLWLDLDEMANRVVVGVEPSADLAGLRALARQRGVPVEALDIQQSTPYQAQTTLQDQFRPMQGGTQIQRVAGTSRATCTLGFAALWNSQQVFLTAGHCSPNLMSTDSVAQYQPVAPLTHADSATTTSIGREIFRYSVACGNNLCASSDAAIYGPVATQNWMLGRMARPTSGCMPGPCSPVILTVNGYWVIDTTHASFVVNDLVSKVGSSTGLSQGYVSRTCVDVSPTHGVTYRCQMFANYGANDGDSGAPILLDIQGGTDSNVTLGGIHSGKSGSNSVFSPWSGIVQDYGSLVVVAAPPDTIWRLLTDSLPDLDTLKVVSLPGDTFRVYRTDIAIRFNSDVSNSAKAAFFGRHSMTVLGVTVTGKFFVRIPDPGLSAAELFQALDALRSEPEVALAIWVPRDGFPQVRDYRLPVDGPGQQRVDWLPTSNSTWAMRAIRAPLAWGCQTGTYDSSRARLAILEWKHQPAHPEFAASSPRLWEAPEALLAPRYQPQPAVTVDSMEAHASATTGLLSAEGNNGSGIAGVNWRSRLYLYAGYSSGNRALPLESGFYVLRAQLVADSPRVLSVSTDQRVLTSVSPADRERFIRDLVPDVQLALDQLPGLLVVVAAGNERYRGTVTNYIRDTAATLLRGALLLLREDPRYRDRIVVVTGTYVGNNFWDRWAANPALGSNFFTGVTDLAAPAQEVTVLDRWTGQTGAAVPTAVKTGTSLSAPLVAGVAGLLLAMDSTLTPAQLKDHIVRGARQPRLNRQTGVFGPPQPVSGAPETVYQLDAYGALTLLASERSIVPLCGNRVWVAGTQLVAQRDTGAPPQVLADIGDTSAFVNVHHGGRRVDVWNHDFDPLSFVFNQGTWILSGNPPASPDGGAWNSLWSLSHDGDTAVTIVNHSGAGQATLEVRRGPTGGSSIHVADIVVPLPSSGTMECIFVDAPSGECMDSRLDGTSDFLYWYAAAYSPLGDRVIVSISTARSQTTSFGSLADCPWDTGPEPRSQCITHIDYAMSTIGTAYHQITLSTGADTVLASPTSAPVIVFWAAVGEDGEQLVTGEGVVSQTSTLLPDTNFVGFHQDVTSQATTDCTLRYRQASGGVAPRFQTASIDACRGPLGGGTLAPAPKISSRTQ